ncbi:MAG: hypothetical protein JKX88_03910, partial [Marinicaulis sp.]|nr:hypothetical protein [Marinicaulis sp.]
IASQENVNIARDGLWMISRAAEGSVRDALSILDQAIVQHAAQGVGDEEVGVDTIRDMLGLADRTGVWELLDACFKGDAKTALDGFRTQYDAGAEPSVILRDLLDLVHLLTRIKAAGPSAAAHGPAGEADATRAKTMSDVIEMNALTRAWGLLMKGLSETNIAPDPAAAGEMALIRLCFAADLPTPDEALRALKKNSAGGSSVSASAVGSGGAPASSPTAQTASQNNAPTGDSSAPPQSEPMIDPAPAVSEPTIYEIEPPLSQRPANGAPWLRCFNDVVRLAGEKRDAKLRTELEAYVHIISFAEGRIELRFVDAAPSDLAGRLTQRLKEWTGRQWVVSVNTQQAGAATVRDARMAEVLAHPMVQKTMALFPGAEVTSIREVVAAVAPSPDEADEEPPADPDVDFKELDPKTGKA